MPRGERAKGLRVVCSASVFVPKPFTPFQWEPQDTQEMVREKQSHLREKLHIKGVTFNYHESDLSYLEACFARGDRRMGQVLLRAYQKGCMLDGWTELFKYDMWREAFAELGIDPAFYAYRRREKDEIMPWDVIDCGVTKEFLWREKEKAEKAQTTKDCRKGLQRLRPAALQRGVQILRIMAVFEKRHPPAPHRASGHSAGDDAGAAPFGAARGVFQWV